MLIFEKLWIINLVAIILVMILMSIRPIGWLVGLPLLVESGSIILLNLTVIAIRIDIWINLFNTIVGLVCNHSIIALFKSIIIGQSLAFAKRTSLLMQISFILTLLLFVGACYYLWLPTALLIISSTHMSIIIFLRIEFMLLLQLLLLIPAFLVLDTNLFLNQSLLIIRWCVATPLICIIFFPSAFPVF